MASYRKPKRNPAGLLVSLLLLMLMVIALFIILRSCAADEPASTPTPTAAATAAPAAEATETPEPTETPTPTPEPTPEPTEEPSPTPEPTEEPVPDASGSFRSNTGTGLNLFAEWSTVSSGEDLLLTVTLSAESYSLQCTTIYNGATVVIDGESYDFSTQPVDYDGSSGLAYSELGSVTISLPKDTTTISISASWNFGGSYSGTELETITAEGTAYIG